MAQRDPRTEARLTPFTDEKEAGDFWDTHSPEDFPDEFREVSASFAKPLIKRGLTVKLSDETLDELRRRAQEKGIGPSTLVRIWIMERLRHANS